jgi:hypothetical protein
VLEDDDEAWPARSAADQRKKVDNLVRYERMTRPKRARRRHRI